MRKKDIEGKEKRKKERKRERDNEIMRKKE